MARIMRNGKMHQKSFSRKKHKTWKAAELAGREWIEEKKKELGPSRANEVGRMTKRNKSGVVGVCRLVKTVRKNGNVYQYPQWNAKWPECPLKGGIRFTVTKDLPEDDAYAMAVIARQMESVDRKAIKTKLNRIRNKKSHHAIMEMRKDDAIPAAPKPAKAKTKVKKTAAKATAAKPKATRARKATATKAKSTVAAAASKSGTKAATPKVKVQSAKPAVKAKAKPAKAAPKAKAEAKKTAAKPKTRAKKAAPKAKAAAPVKASPKAKPRKRTAAASSAKLAKVST